MTRKRYDLSPTSIDRYRACPRRFYYQDVLRSTIEERKSFEQVLGEAVHKGLEQLMRLPASSRDAEAAVRLADVASLRFAASNGYDNHEHEQLRDQCSTLVQRYVSSGDVSANVLKTERPFALTLSNGTVIKTRVDRIDRNARGLLEVIDYKSGRSQLDQRDLAYETAPIVQMLAVGKASDVPVERITWVYLRSGESVSWWPEAEDVDAATERLISVLKDIHADETFEPNPGSQCSWCPFKSMCEAARTEADAIQLGSATTEQTPHELPEAA
jgi:putative RecB family exonuclease